MKSEWKDIHLFMSNQWINVKECISSTFTISSCRPEIGIHAYRWHVCRYVCNTNILIRLKVSICVNEKLNNMSRLMYNVTKFIMQHHIRYTHTDKQIKEKIQSWWRRSWTHQSCIKQKIDTPSTIDKMFAQFVYFYRMWKAVECYCLRKCAARMKDNQLWWSILQFTAIYEKVSLRNAHATKQIKSKKK